MIVVDSSVWIAHFRDDKIAEVGRFRSLDETDILVGDLILLECLQGARGEAHASQIERAMRTFPVASMLGEAQAIKTAELYRGLRANGRTPRSPIDLVVGSYCIANNHHLLHADRDFVAMEQLFGLRVI